MSFDIEEISDEEAEREVSSNRGRTSRFEPVGEQWEETEEGNSLRIPKLEKKDIQSLRNFMYNNYGKENVIVRSSKTGDDEYTAIVQRREGDKYLRNGEDESETEEEE